MSDNEFLEREQIEIWGSWEMYSVYGASKAFAKLMHQDKKDEFENDFQLMYETKRVMKALEEAIRVGQIKHRNAFTREVIPSGQYSEIGMIKAEHVSEWVGDNYGETIEPKSVPRIKELEPEPVPVKGKPETLGAWVGWKVENEGRDEAGNIKYGYKTRLIEMAAKFSIGETTIRGSWKRCGYVKNKLK